jgi:hypothetical protein
VTIIKKLLHVTAILFVTVTLFCYIGWKLGYDGLILVGETKLPEIVSNWTAWLFYNIHIYLLSGFILNIYGRKLLRVLFPLFTIDIFFRLIIVHVVPVPPEVSTIVLVLYWAACAIYFGTKKNTAINFLKYMLILLAYQAVMLVIKTGHFNLGYNMLSIYENLMVCIDNLIFTALLYGIGGEQYGRRALERILHSEEIDTPSDDKEDCDEVDAWRQLQGFVRFRAMALLLLFQLFQWALILFVCKIGDVFVEGVVISGSFVVYGLFVKNRWHSKSLIVCTLTTCAMFYLAARAIPAFGYTQLMPVVVGLLLIYGLYRVALFTNKKYPK